MKRAVSGIALFLLILSCTAAELPRKADVHVLTALPLFFGGGDMRQALDGGPHPFIQKLSKNRQVIPLDTLQYQKASAIKRLVLIQPALLPPAELVALDDWTRAGGQLLILTDPDLVWTAGFAPNDPRAPPPSTLLDPLFAHWGLSLGGKRSAPFAAKAELEGHQIILTNPGRWEHAPSGCVTKANQLLATCQIGKGRVTLFADVDILDPQTISASGSENIDALIALVDGLYG